MIDPKYAGLPGIAYDQPDVYETDNVPENKSSEDYLEVDSDSVNIISTSVPNAFKKFQKDCINLNPGMGYNLCSDEYELNNRNENESPFLKYQHIKYEMKALMDQLTTINANTNVNRDCKSLTDLISDIQCTSHELDALNKDLCVNENMVAALSDGQEIRLRELKSQIEIFKQNKLVNSDSRQEQNLQLSQISKHGILKYNMVYLPDKSKMQDFARISHLEKRIGYLENLVGMSIDNTSNSSQIVKFQGISRSVKNLIRTISILDVVQLGLLENGVTSVIHKMDNLNQKKTSISLDIKYEKFITELYDLVKKSENNSQVLAQTIDRMISLTSLHKKAADFVNQFKELEELQQKIKCSFLSNKLVLEEIKKNYSDNLNLISSNITALNERVKKLQK